NYFGILAPQLTGYVIDNVQLEIKKEKDSVAFERLHADMEIKEKRYDLLVKGFISSFGSYKLNFGETVLLCGILLLVLALLRGFF
ncbi:hypothetical protein, partial [Rhizobium leguminosarum]|uniref:hypothetical protein n=1 Tax=Rhizobium leguminosarum TaxID=384 RepID=UPI003F9AB48A